MSAHSGENSLQTVAPRELRQQSIRFTGPEPGQLGVLFHHTIDGSRCFSSSIQSLLNLPSILTNRRVQVFNNSPIRVRYERHGLNRKPVKGDTRPEWKMEGWEETAISPHLAPDKNTLSCRFYLPGHPPLYGPSERCPSIPNAFTGPSSRSTS